MPSALYGVFMKKFLLTVREEIAAGVETSYNTLSFADAKDILYIKKSEDMIKFGKDVSQKSFHKIGNFFLF